MTTFDDLLAPVSVEGFLKDSAGQAPLLINGPADKFDGLFDWDQLNAALNGDFLRPPRMRLIVKGDEVESSHFVHGEGEDQSLNAARVTDSLRNGAVMVINFVDRLFPQLGEVAESLSDLTRAESQINLYCGWQASKGFNIHWDRHDVWVLQVEGEKVWEIWEPTNEHPLPGDTGAKPQSEPAQTLTLTQGDLLYVPRGWWHRAEALDGVSVHMTLGSRPPTGTDFVSTMKHRLRDRPEWRSTLGPVLDASVEEELAALTSAESLQAFLDSEAARLLVRPDFALPHVVTDPKPEISGGTLVKLAWTRGLEFRTNGDGTMRVTSLDLHIGADVVLMPYLARLSGLTWQTIDEVAEGIEDRKVRRKLLFFMTTLEMKSALLTRTGP